MSRIRALAAAGIIALAAIGSASAQNTFRYAFQGDLKVLDPYTLNETFTIGTLGNVYEGLIRRGPNLEIQPALAESWEIVEPLRWRFHLRKGVKFHNGNDFNADDVVFSAERVRHENSNLKSRIGADVEVVKVDDHTVDFILPGPNPILHYEWETWAIMDKEWSEANESTVPVTASDTNPNYAALNTNGTGPFRITSHQAGVKTVFEANPDWWDEPDRKHNLQMVELNTIASDATRVAALLSGDMDMIYPVPAQDIARINGNAGTKVLTGPELRTIFLGFDQMRDELPGSDVKGKNPFKDPRVRKAIYQAIDTDAITDRIMRGLAKPNALMISPYLFSRSDAFERHPYDVAAAKALLAEAGYPDGFAVTMDCPNDRYVNDEAICQAVAAMLAKIGVRVDLNAQPKAQYFAKILQSGGYDTSFYLLGWTPVSFDSWNVLNNLINCRDEKGNGAAFNIGGYCNQRIDELTGQILEENDAAKRDALIAEAFSIAHDEVAYVPLHQQGLAWGVNDKISIVQRPDNQVMLYHVQKN